MRAYDIILKKRDGSPLTSDEIEYMVLGYTAGSIPDSQMAAWLMAIYFRGMSTYETTSLTMAMVKSGKVLDLSMIPGIKVDKHSTGGVGDKTTIVLVPLLAAAGIPMVKMAGRSLGHTGGTIDKLESIPNFRTSLSPEQVIQQVNKIGAAITSQTSDLVPADKKIYALRDLTATVESIPLIASSIMSKKIAGGADAFVLDVKVGSGAFMKTLDSAEELAELMVKIGNTVHKQTVAILTDMDQPLGRAVGNSIEVKEAIDTLHGQGPSDLVELCEELGAAALVLAGECITVDEGKRKINELIINGKGAEKLQELIKAQDGNPNVVTDPSLLPTAPIMVEVTSVSSGYVNRLDALKIAVAESLLGGGRAEIGTSPDLSVGIYLYKKRGDTVISGQPLAKVFASNMESAQHALNMITDAYEIINEPPKPVPLIHKKIGFD